MTINSKLISVSGCGKYVYPIDSITGARTFALVDYFKKMLDEKYGGSQEKFVKEYITRETRKYLAEGWTPQEIKELAATCKNKKLPKINPKPKKDPNAPKKPRKKRLSAHVESTQTITNSDGTQEVVKTYAWSIDPTNYFKSDPVPLNIGETTRETCLRPDIYLNEGSCQDCPYTAECQCELKYKK